MGPGCPGAEPLPRAATGRGTRGCSAPGPGGRAGSWGGASRVLAVRGAEGRRARDPRRAAVSSADRLPVPAGVRAAREQVPEPPLDRQHRRASAAGHAGRLGGAGHQRANPLLQGVWGAAGERGALGSRRGGRGDPGHGAAGSRGGLAGSGARGGWERPGTTTRPPQLQGVRGGGRGDRLGRHTAPSPPLRPPPPSRPRPAP